MLLFSCSAAAAAKSLQSCPTLCDPIDGSPPGSSVPGILQARTQEWVSISFSNAWEWYILRQLSLMKPNFLSLSEVLLGLPPFLPSVLSSLLFSFFPSSFLLPSFKVCSLNTYIPRICCMPSAVHAKHNVSLIAQLVKNPPAMQETPVWFLRWEDPLEKG